MTSLRGWAFAPNLIYDAARNKANLFATLSAEPDRIKTGGLVISGHTDTVPVDGQDWSSDPFVADHRDRRIHGRGTADMKGFIAIALAAVPKFLAAQERLPLHLSLTYDEETTFFGVRDLLADLADRGIRPAGCIIGEPTDMRAIVAHKGKRDMCCRVRGREAHSSLTPDGVNAIEFAARLVAFIRQTADSLSQRGKTRCALCGALHDVANRCDQGRHCRQCRSARLRVHFRDAQLAGNVDR